MRDAESVAMEMTLGDRLAGVPGLDGLRVRHVPGGSEQPSALECSLGGVTVIVAGGVDDGPTADAPRIVVVTRGRRGFLVGGETAVIVTLSPPALETFPLGRERDEAVPLWSVRTWPAGERTVIELEGRVIALDSELLPAWSRPKTPMDHVERVEGGRVELREDDGTLRRWRVEDGRAW